MENKKNEQLIEGMKIATFPLPPEGFDPLTAEQSKLHYYGFPTRPDKEKEPELYKRWHAVYSQKLKHITPEFKKMTRKGAARHGKPLSFGPYTKNTWSGAVLESSTLIEKVSIEKIGSKETVAILPEIVPTDKPGYYRGVQGTWQYPDLFANENLSSEFQDSSCDIWIGLDGKDISANNSPLQVGSSSFYNAPSENDGQDPASNSPLWMQWGGTVLSIPNITAFPGNQLQCLICVEENNKSALICIIVQREYYIDSTSFMIYPQNGDFYVGNCAEWILENSNSGPANNPIPPFPAITFTDCYAFSLAENGSLISASPNATNLCDMVGANKKYETKTTLTGNNGIQIEYLYPLVTR